MEDDLEQSDLEDSSDRSSSPNSDLEEAGMEEPSSFTNLGETGINTGARCKTDLEKPKSEMLKVLQPDNRKNYVLECLPSV